MILTIDSRDLKEQLKNLHSDCSEEFNVRIRRAMSWMQRAEQEYNKEADIRFIFLWIGFNALYGHYIPSDKLSESKEAKIFREFLGKILSLVLVRKLSTN